MVYTILDSATVLKSSKLPLVQDSDEITIEQPTATASGTDTYTATISGIESYETGLIVGILFTNANTTSSTLNINSLGAKTLKKSVSTNLAASDISSGQALLLYYDGTNFQVIGLGGSGGSGTPGGSDTQVQFNDGGAFGGDANFTFNKTTNTLTIEEIENDSLELAYLRSLTQLVW